MPLDLGDGYVHPPHFHIGRVEARAGRGDRYSLTTFGGRPGAAVHPGVHPAPSQRAARSLSSATLRGPGRPALSRDPLLDVPEGALHLALAFGVTGLAGPDSVPRNWANSGAGGWRLNRLPLDVPSAPMRSVRRILGTPPTRSKKRTNPSKVCWRSTERGEPPDTHLEQLKMAEKHGPRSPHSRVHVRTRPTSRTGFLHLVRSRSG